MKDSNQLQSFDILRALAILIIFFHHLPGYCYNFYELNFFGRQWDLTVVNRFNRYFGLGLFVFMSGYLSNREQRSFGSFQTIKAYLISKVLRIFPLYYLAFVMFCYIYKIYEPLRIINHLLGLQLLFKTDQLMPSPTLWFIGLTWTYYYIYIFTFYENINVNIKRFVLVVIPIFILLVNKCCGVMDTRLVLYYIPFLTGLYCANTKLIEKIKPFHGTISGLIVLGGLIVFKADIMTLTPFTSIKMFMLITFIMMAFVLMAVSVSNMIAGSLYPRLIINMVAYSSFCVYLFHRPLLYCFNELFVWFPSLNMLYKNFIALVIIALPLIFLTCFFIQKIYDRILFKMTTRG